MDQLKRAHVICVIITNVIDERSVKGITFGTMGVKETVDCKFGPKR